MQKFFSIRSIIITLVLILILSAIPIGLYIYKFGIGLLGDMKKWADVGTFFGGVLGPAFTFFSTILLLITVYLTNQSLLRSQDSLKQSQDALQVQQNLAEKQSFDSLFFNQLQMLLEHIRAAKFKENNKFVNLDSRLSEKFKDLTQLGDNFDALIFLPYLSQANEAFDQLVILIEDHAPNHINKSMYRDTVRANLSVHFRFYIGQVWIQTHPNDPQHLILLRKYYGIIQRDELQQTGQFVTRF